MKSIFRKAEKEDFPAIWEIIKFAKKSRKEDGSSQWQDGYPHESSIENDIENGYGYVLCDEYEVLLYAAVIFEIEPAYEEIKGRWLSEGKYGVVHRMAVSQRGKGKGLSEKMLLNIEALSRSKNTFSLKIDTNFDNGVMLYLVEKLGYTYCGKVYFRGSERLAFEKLLK